MRLIEELNAAGWPNDAEAFREMLADVFANTYRGWTDEQLILRPRDSLHYCNLVRTHAKLSDLPDEVILGAILNDRKQGRWKVRLELLDNCEIDEGA